jgi:hypothetical protein
VVLCNQRSCKKKKKNHLNQLIAASARSIMLGSEHNKLEEKR